MGSHSDNDARRGFLDELRIRAELMSELGKNSVANDTVLEAWDENGVRVEHLPDDRQGILRISIGGGDHLPIKGDYCNFRGDQSQCIKLLERALAAMKAQ